MFVTRLAKITPWNSGAPHINGPPIYGARPGAPFMFAIPVTGQRPLRFSLSKGKLPAGLALDSCTGIITGMAAGKSVAKLLVNVKNKLGRAQRELEIVIGDAIALTPPMGWNSWNCWGDVITAEKIRRAADDMVSSGLAAHGYSYVNIDSGWQGKRGGKYHAIQGHKGFPDMRALCNHIHQKGLKAGIYSTPWVRSYCLKGMGFTGGSSGKNSGTGSPYYSALKQKKYVGIRTYDRKDAMQWAEWGFDYLKYDWFPNDVPSAERMNKALAACGRDIVFSLSNNAPFNNAGDWARLANCWRTTGDITDTWESIAGIGFQQDRWSRYTSPGHWSDPDMLVLGKIGWSNIRDCRLTRDEQITHMSLWTLLASPLIVGCDLSRLDEWTLQLLCNDEVLAVNQDRLGDQACCFKEIKKAHAGEILSHQSVYARKLSDGAVAVGLFNRGPRDELLGISWADLNMKGARRVRDLWANRDIGVFDGSFSIGVPPHGAQLVKIESV